MRTPRRLGSRVCGAALALWLSLPSTVLHAQLTPPPTTSAPNTPPPTYPSTPAPDEYYTSAGLSSSSGGGDHDSGGGRSDFSGSNDGSDDGSAGSDRWGDAGWGSQGSASSSSSSSGNGGWGNLPRGADWDGLWKFKGGWNWDTPYPPAGITLETDIDGEVALMPRRKVFFNPSMGFSASRSGGGCAHRFCLRVSISSNYGAMSAFDAFVMDRYESKSDVGSNGFAEGGPVPLVNGMLTPSELQMMYNGSANESAVSRYNHTRQTSWTLYPLSNDTDEIDIVMSFKQLYTLLPDYNGTDPASDGPFYSEDPNDQVILRVSARLASPFGASTALLPLVFEHKGSRLFDVNYTSSIVYDDEDSYSSHQIDLNLVFTRKGYGGFIPWMPAQPSEECRRCEMQMMDSSVFGDCLQSFVGDSVFSNLLSPESNVTTFDLSHTRDECFRRLIAANDSSPSPSSSSASASWSSSSPSSSSSTASSPSSSSSSAEASSPSSSSSSAPARRLSEDSGSATGDESGGWRDAVLVADAGVRCFIDSQCPIGDNLNYPSDGNMVVFACKDAVVRATFSEPEFAFSMSMSVLDEPGISTDVISSNFTEVEVAEVVRRAIPDGGQLNITARLFNNSLDIFYANMWNEWLMSEYARELASAKSSGSSSSGSSSSEPAASVSSDGSADAEGSPGASQGGSPSGSTSGSTLGGEHPPPPQRRLSSALTPPALYTVPSPNFTVEITFGNVSVVPSVTKVVSSKSVEWEYSPIELGFELSPLDVSKFSYVPPPATLDLGEQGGSGSDGGSFGNITLDYLPGSCGECVSQYRACAADANCLFGVRTYFYQALQPKSAYYGSSFDISSVIRNAYMTVPFRGVDKFAAFVSCLASRSPPCNVATTTVDPSSTTATSQQPSPTHLRIESARISIDIPFWSSFSFSTRDRSYYYYYDYDRSTSLQSYLETSLGWNTSISVNVTSPNGSAITTNDYYQQKRYTIEFANELYETPFFQMWNTPSEVRHEPWRLLAEAQDGAAAARSVNWQQLLQWLQPLTLDAGGYVDYVQPTGYPIMSNLGKYRSTPVNPDAICPACMDKLNSCLSDYECARDAREFLLTRLDPSAFVQTLSPQTNSYRAPFADALVSWKSQVTPLVFNKFVDVLNCMSMSSCAAGYREVTPSIRAANHTLIPTTVSIGHRLSFVVEPSSTIEVSYNGSSYFYNDTGNWWQFSDFLRGTVMGYNNYVYWNSMVPSSTWDGKSQYDLQTNQLLREVPVVVASDTTEVKSQEVMAVFVSNGAAMATWTNLRRWFGVQSAALSSSQPNMVPASDVCTECIPSIMECLNDPLCAANVRDNVVPNLRGIQTNPFGSAKYSVSISEMGATIKVSLDTILGDSSAISSTPSINLLVNALKCFTARPCDLDYFSGDQASAHPPTYLKLQDGSIEVVLLEGAALSVTFMGEQREFVQGGDSSAFSEWLTQWLDGRVAVSFPAVAKYPDIGEYHYTVEFTGYYGALPEFVTSSVGEPSGTTRAILLTKPNLRFESLIVVPYWQKLIDYLSVTPATSVPIAPPASSMYNCSECTAALHNCFNDYMCQLTLKTYAIPNLRTRLSQTYNGYQVESNFTGWMTWQVLPMAGSEQSRKLLMEVFKCSAANSCIASSGDLAYSYSQANLTLEYPTASFSMPAGAQMTIYYGGKTTFIQDSEDTASLESFLETTVLSDQSVDVQVKRLVGDDVSVVQYRIVFNDLYSLSVPHFSWESMGGASGPASESTETGWRFVFSSMNWDLTRYLQWWIEWLATNGNPVAISVNYWK